MALRRSFRRRDQTEKPSSQSELQGQQGLQASAFGPDFVTQIKSQILSQIQHDMQGTMREVIREVVQEEMKEVIKVVQEEMKEVIKVVQEEIKEVIREVIQEEMRRQQQPPLQQQVNEQMSQPQVEARPSTMQTDWVSRFREEGPMKFEVNTRPDEAWEWVKKMEDIFEFIHVPAEIKVCLATRFLIGEARRWWETMKAVHENQLTWEEFVKLFLAEYFPRSVQMARRREYYNLKQGNMTVAEYVKVFTDLGRFALDSWRVEAHKTQDFIDGLRPTLRECLSILELTTYNDAVNKALIAERGLDQVGIQRSREVRGPNQKRPREEQSVGQGDRIPARRFLSHTRASGSSSTTWFAGNCRFCGVAGHKEKDCHEKSGRPI